MTGVDRHEALEAARVGAELSIQELWLRYVALSGTSDAFDVDGFLQGLVTMETFQQDVLAQAVNEGLEEHYLSLRVPLSGIGEDGMVDGTLADVIDQILAPRPSAPAAQSAPPGDEEHPLMRPPRPQPEG